MANLSADERKNLLRILDANWNRACEGLRVLEEFVRFHKEDTELTKWCKDLRHDIRGVWVALPLAQQQELCASRNIATDVLAKDYTASEGTRESLADVFWANAQRVKEALRVLEEYGKILSPKVGQEMQVLRFRMYELEQHLSAKTDVFVQSLKKK